MIVTGCHLPHLDEGRIEGWDERAAGDVVLRMPRLSPGAIAAVADSLRSAQRRLQTRSVDSIMAVIDHVAQRLLDPDDRLRTLAEAALPHLTGYSAAMIRHILDGMAADWRRPALERLIHAELGGVDVLERAVQRAGRRALAVPHPLLLHVFAGNIPGVAVTSLVRALLVRAASLGKTAAGEPLLAALFAQAVAEHDRDMGDALAVVYWRGGDRAIEDVAFHEADAIVAYGGGRALGEIRSRAPAHVPVLDHGPRLSAGFIARDALTDDIALQQLARDAARAIATFDQQGCVSPHAIYVEQGDIDADRFATQLADALHVLEAELPRGRLTAAEASAIRETRTRAEFAPFAGSTARLLSPPDAPFTVILHQGAAFEPSCLQRTIHVYAVRSIDEGLAALRPHRPSLQSAALAGGDDRLIRRLAHAGFTRITSFAQLPWPTVSGYHDGRGPLTELLRFVTVESV